MKLRNMARKFGVIAAGTSTVVAGLATSAMAELSAGDLTTIQTGIQGSDTNYFAIGGTILVVLAGIWGFKLVKRLF